jgi:tetratricopeptide (TPR) repeat protein
MLDPGGDDLTFARISTALRERFELIRRIDSGGMAHVYLARDRTHARDVAIKVLRPEIADLVGTQRFSREIKVEASVQHPNILPLYESGSADGLPYLVTPYVEGGSLRDRLKRDKQLPIEEAVRITREVALALGTAHEQGILHRDVKPSNILLDRDRPLVADFGIAKAMFEAGEDRLTLSGVAIGTPGYMSPEQATGAPDTDHRSDVYSLACVLHEMLTGEMLFSGSSPRAIVAKHIAIPPIPVRTLRPRIPERIERALLWALEKNPVDRCPTMNEFVKALEGSVVAPSPGIGTSHSQRRFVIKRPVATTVTTAVIVAGLYAASRIEPRGPSWDEPPASVVVLGFREPGSTTEEGAVAAVWAETLTAELQNWDAIRAATGVDVAGPSRDLGLPGPALNRLEDGIALARVVEAEAMVALTARVERDSAVITARLVDVRSGRPGTESITLSGPAASSAQSLSPLVARVVGFAHAPEPVRVLGAGTRRGDAAAAYLSGIAELGRHRLDAAESQFRVAVSLDSVFATAMTRLAQTLYWRIEENPALWNALAPELSRLATTATDYLDGLAPNHRRHVQAFYAFQLGDFEQARTLYANILEADSQDIYALLMIAEIEGIDPWLNGGEDQQQPRANLNRALASLLEAVRIRPTFELAYESLFETLRAIERPLGLLSVCPVFEEFRGQMVAPWRAPTPAESGATFCPVVQDSVRWITKSEFDTVDHEPYQTGAGRISRQTVAAFEQWAAFSPNQPRAFDRIADALLLERARMQSAAPERLKELAERALVYAERAASLQTNLTVEQLATLANLNLAADRIAVSVELSRRSIEVAQARDDSGLGQVPASIMNVLVASGQTSLAMEVGGTRSFRRYMQSPATRELIGFAGAEPIVERIRVLGAVGAGGPSLHEELEGLDRVWQVAGYSTETRSLLWSHVTLGAPAIVTSLVHDADALARWGEMVITEDPLWRALTLSSTQPPSALELYGEAAETDAGGLPPSARAFLLGTIAARLGLQVAAIQHYSRLDSIPHLLDAFDPGWGLQVLSELRRANAYQALGDAEAQADHYNRYRLARSLADAPETTGP